MHLLGLLHAAITAPRRRPRILARHSLPHKLVFQQYEVSLNPPSHFILMPLVGKNTQEPQKRAPHLFTSHPSESLEIQHHSTTTRLSSGEYQGTVPRGTELISPGRPRNFAASEIRGKSWVRLRW